MKASNLTSDVLAKQTARRQLERQLAEYFAKGGTKKIAPYGMVAEDFRSTNMKLEEITDGRNQHPKAPVDL